ncbi:MAG: hypothetical protein JSV04_10475 [Candidatus Heimdallarchaeota archaeon]|nr:MAG: hypothetical protein JSV04_10475 [Candidatus Heimdallarchaeota archaeon]
MLSKSFLKEVEAIHNDTHSGAAEIASDCLDTLKRECLRLSTRLDRSILKTAISLLLDTHPMATIENALLPVFLQLTNLLEPGGIQQGDPKAAIEVVFATRREQMRIGEKNTIETLVKVLQEKKSILTFSHSSTVTTALLQLARDGYRDKEIYILESRPLREGKRTAQTIATAGFKKIHLGIDLAVNEFSQNTELAVLGADMIHPNGQVLNKIGSATIAHLFHMRSKELIVAASPSKICLRGLINHDQDWHPVIPHRDPKEITTISSPNLVIWNKYFEIIDPDCITSLVMDRHQFPSPIEKPLKEFLKSSVIKSQLDTLREIWHDVDFTMV